MLDKEITIPISYFKSYHILDDFCLTVVSDILAITGGSQDSSTTLTWNLIMSGGVECLGHDLPDHTVQAAGIGIAQAYDRFIYLCGGKDGTSNSFFKLPTSMFRYESSPQCMITIWQHKKSENEHNLANKFVI